MVLIIRCCAVYGIQGLYHWNKILNGMCHKKCHFILWCRLCVRSSTFAEFTYTIVLCSLLRNSGFISRITIRKKLKIVKQETCWWNHLFKCISLKPYPSFSQRTPFNILVCLFFTLPLTLSSSFPINFNDNNLWIWSKLLLLCLSNKTSYNRN